MKCYIVGKGPSLANLNVNDISDGIIITLNEAIQKIEENYPDCPVYSMQKDGCGTTEPHEICSGQTAINMTRPQRAALIVHQTESPECFKDYEPRYIFDNQTDFNIPWYAFSALSAMEIADLMGCSEIYLCCFDACINGDARTYIPATRELQPHHEGYLQQATLMAEYLNVKGVVYQWVIPSNC